MKRPTENTHGGLQCVDGMNPLEDFVGVCVCSTPVGKGKKSMCAHLLREVGGQARTSRG